MVSTLSNILRCPRSHELLSYDDERHQFVTASGPAYAFDDAVGRFLEPVSDADENRKTRKFYDETGWAIGEDGLYADTRAFLDTRPAQMRFTRACMTRLSKYFRHGGTYLVDAGSGPIAHKELIEYGRKFEKRVCIDLSISALEEAKRKLGDRGVYLQGDLTNLPLQDNVADAVMCFHVIYQLPVNLQAKAFMELWRILKPGGVAIVPYWWADAKLPDRLAGFFQLKRKLFGALRRNADPNNPPTQSQTHQQEETVQAPDHNPLSYAWFKIQPWPFRYKVDIYRVVENSFMKRYVPGDWRGSLFLGALMLLQRVAPTYCGRNGVMPAIVIYKSVKDRTISHHEPA